MPPWDTSCSYFPICHPDPMKYADLLLLSNIRKYFNHESSVNCRAQVFQCLNHWFYEINEIGLQLKRRDIAYWARAERISSAGMHHLHLLSLLLMLYQEKRTTWISLRGFQPSSLVYFDDRVWTEGVRVCLSVGLFMIWTRVGNLAWQAGE